MTCVLHAGRNKAFVERASARPSMEERTEARTTNIHLPSSSSAVLKRHSPAAETVGEHTIVLDEPEADGQQQKKQRQPEPRRRVHLEALAGFQGRYCCVAELRLTKREVLVLLHALLILHLACSFGERETRA